MYGVNVILLEDVTCEKKPGAAPAQSVVGKRELKANINTFLAGEEEVRE